MCKIVTVAYILGVKNYDRTQKVWSRYTKKLVWKQVMCVNFSNPFTRNREKEQLLWLKNFLMQYVFVSESRNYKVLQN
jgi:hypothetical protein